ncbi:MAG: CpsD/CapB family tyrosine-protein kinase [Gemmatimonadota bacterium]|nr:CpsD/CapB family tyrosine-protein kinase [Gemmatimonadota bacterium]MDP7032368.1 CpsD/CapB family tyrosine-protein kinase [Gemmatimonadota bacterium]
MSKIRDAMNRARTGANGPETEASAVVGGPEAVPAPEPDPASQVAPPAQERGPGGLVPAMSADTLQYLESIGKQVEVALGPTERRALVFTAPVPEEGVSSVVSQFAQMLSLRGEKVLLIDGNPRHPSVQATFDVPGSPGLAEHMTGKADQVDIIRKTEFANLSVVAMGSCADRMQAEAVTEGLGQFVESVAAEYDYVLVDVDHVGSPFFSTALVGSADGLVLVIRSGQTNRAVANRACETVRQVGGRILGVVLNRREFPIPDFIYRRL